MDEASIKATDKNYFKKPIKKKIKYAALKLLCKTKDTHSKISNIKYDTDNWTVQYYFVSPQFSNDEASLKFALRSHMVRDIKKNFSSIYRNNMPCPLNCQEEEVDDDQVHLLHCPVLLRVMTHE